MDSKGINLVCEHIRQEGGGGHVLLKNINYTFDVCKHGENHP